MTEAEIVQQYQELLNQANELGIEVILAGGGISLKITKDVESIPNERFQTVESAKEFLKGFKLAYRIYDRMNK